jgi:hypothetical protein
LASTIDSHGRKYVRLFAIMPSRFIFSACWRRATVSLIGERVATYPTVASTASRPGRGSAW